jgi:hypothetical protein
MLYYLLRFKLFCDLGCSAESSKVEQ